MRNNPGTKGIHQMATSKMDIKNSKINEILFDSVKPLLLSKAFPDQGSKLMMPYYSLIIKCNQATHIHLTAKCTS